MTLAVREIGQLVERVYACDQTELDGTPNSGQDTKQAPFALFKSKRKLVNFVYGEIEFHSVAKLLELLQPCPGQVLVDLGCGAGKVCGSKHV